MKISEIFYSVQGEGQLVGVPSVFVRTSGCNLRCRWCDTPYASWNPEGEEIELGQIVDEVKKHPAKHVVLTGGEPMITKGIRELAGMFKQLGYHITIETAGTVAPEGIACDLGSISPKLANSTPDGSAGAWQARHEKTRIQIEALRAWAGAVPCQWKFVVSSREDLPEIEDLMSRLEVQVLPHQILLMPEGIDVGTLKQRQSELVAICMERGYRYCPRLHIELFGNTRGT